MPTPRECNVVSGMPRTRMSNRTMFAHMFFQTVVYLSVPFSIISSIPYMRDRNKDK
ncbi:unnamed protein product [Acanthoscelides obtectus]|uniref:Uncharacterized protein n=1 Tax=Acanthoscelides obtectus TaxID=200917 RepID=A0A9P0KX15_ACAOB|nr:unnamed protein product [Acanthoscelides obtectus]CAK1652635.1 hypothetical protein AOBTE_LOCUS17875 [Acanthoscelides obtectus]